MRRFFFDVQSGELTTTDRAGEWFRDLASAQEASLNILASVAADEMPRTGRRDFALTLRDENGRVVFTVSFGVEAPAQDNAEAEQRQELRIGAAVPN